MSRIEDGISGAISTQSMLLCAYKELLICKNNAGIPAYGATLIFATLFEKDIKEHTKRIYAKQYLKSLQTKIALGSIALTEAENNLFDYLQYQYGVSTKRATTMQFDGVVACTKMQYDLYKKYNIVSDDADIKKLICNEFTLNNFLQSSLFRNIADDRFVKVVTLLFSVSKLNLRNNMAHCNFTYSNFYSIHITALLYILCAIVSEEEFLK